MRKNDIEKSLKRFLKRKVSYSLSLLIAFMITGGISLGAGITAEEIQETKSDLLTKIQTEREEIKRKIAENERLIKEYNSDFVELVRKGDFYSKPLFNSTQIFFTYQYLDNGKMKDRTDKEFSETIDAINKHYGTKSGRSILRSSGNIGKDKIMSGNGVAVDNESFSETINLGANIKPLNPELPIIEPNISVNVSTPNVSLGSLPGTVVPGVVTIPTVTIPTLILPGAPTPVNVSVSTPSAISAISVTAPAVKTLDTPSGKTINVAPITAPEGYDPLMIIIPSISEKNVTVITPPALPATNVAYQQVPADVTGYNAAGINGGLMSQLELSSGNFNLYFRGYPGSYDYSFSGAAATNDAGTLPASSSGSINVEAFYRHGGKALTTIPSNVNIKVVGNNTGGALNAVYYLGNNYSSGNAESKLISYAKIDMYGNKAVIANIDNVSSPGNITFINQGNIIGYADRGIFDVGKEGNPDIGNFIFGGYSYGNAGIDVIENGSSGNVIFYAPGSMGWAYTSGSVQSIKRSSINNGIMKLYGKKSIGIANNNNGSSTQMAYADIQLNNPIEILGDESVGIYITREPDTTSTNFINSKFNIKLGGIGGLQDSTYGDSKGDTSKVEYSVGLNFDFTLSSTGTEKILNNYKVELDSDVKDSVGIRVGTGTITFNDSNSFSQLILKGEKNIGFIADGASSKLKYNNSNKLTIDGKDQILFATANGGNLEVTNGISLNLANTVTGFTQAYSEGVNSKIELKGGVITTVNGKDSVLFYAKNNGTIELTENTVVQPPVVGGYINGDNTGTPKINILGKDGVIYYSKNGGQIKANNSHAKILDGIVGVYSEDSTSKIEIKNSIIDYSGEGYALYSKSAGKIDASGSMIILRGKATALDLDLSVVSPITLTGAKIVVMSNDAIGVNLKNTGPLNISTLETDIGNALGGVSIISGTDGSQVFDKYKIAAVDGGTLNINANMDKSDTSTTSPGFFYYRRFLGQRLKLNVSTGMEVKSEINSSDATAYFKGQVVGLEMSSSSSATSATDAQINLLANSKVIADRTDAGAGAIGLYMNFGKVDIAAGAIVEVEKGTSGGNIVNAGGVGVYAVNGSTVTNAGEISVAGKNAIGILGMTYREEPMGTPLVNEFGSGGIFTNQGKIEITNNQDIKLDGTGTIGIYAYNNSGGANTNSKVTNTGTIEVGESTTTNAAIGIYGDKSLVANSGNIKTGKEGIGIYGIKGSTISSLGTLTLGADGIGVMVDGTSNITAASVILAAGSGTDVNGKTGIFYKGTGSESQNINIAIDASAFDKGTAVFVEKMNLSSGGQIDVGKDGVGIFLKGNTSSNTATNTGIINLAETGAVGMYTKIGKIINTGTINVNNSTHIGMYAEGTGNTVTNGNIISLNVNNSTGIFVKDDAKTELNIGNNINFISGVTNSLGVFADNATVEFKDNILFSNNNENKNIYVYGKDATVGIDLGKTVTVDGVGTPTTAGNKTVGIYLENEATGSTFTSNTTGQLIVQNEAVGIYSKGNNTLNVNVTATGEKTTGVFIDGGSTITGTVTAQGTPTAGAVGVYGSGGTVTIGAGGLTLNTDLDKGTGMYLTDGAYASGGKITVNNTATVDNIGVYYSKGTASGTVTNGAEVELTGNKSIGIYAADGINLVNTKNITSTGGSNNIASYVGGNSTLTSTGNITMTGTGDNIGIYTGKGSGINNGAIDLTGATGTSSAGMVAKTDTSSDTASVENKNTITVGSNLGIYVAGNGTSSGKNTGTITATTGTGVYVDGAAHSFNGTGGTIASNAVGIYLKDTGANKITAGTLNIGSGGVGVFGENAKIDFVVNVTGAEAVGVAAESGTVISGNITTGQGSVGAYVLDNTVSFNGSVITTGTNSSNTSIGVLLANTIGTYTMNNVTVNAKNGVGIYLGTGANLTHNGTVTTENGIGIYVANGTTLTTGITVLNVKNGGTGVYIDQGTANLGTTGSLTFNFSSGGGIGIYNNGGTMNIGSNISVTGSGSLAATKDGSLTSSGTLNIGTGAVGLLGEYGAATTTPKEIRNTASGIINATSGGIGLAAIKSGAGPGPGALVTITNAGTISASGQSAGNDPSIGIYTDTANVVNTGTINVGANGIGIYAVFNGTGITVQNNNVKMNGSNGIGVYLKDGAALASGNSITGSGSNNTGLVLENTAVPASVGTISLGADSIGVMATGAAATGIINGNISVGAGNNAIGIVATNGANVTLSTTSTVTTGANGIGVYVNTASTAVVNDASKVSVGTGGVYLYSNGGNLSFAGNLVVNDQIGIAANGGTVTTLGATSITVTNGGIGAYIKGSVPTLTGTAINLQSGTASKYSMGIYYDGVTGIGTAPTINQTGNYTIGMVLNNSSGTASGVNISGQNQIGIMAQKGSVLNAGGTVTIAGDKNIGIYGENSNITAGSGIFVGNSTYTTDKSSSSIGIFMKGGTYTGSGNVTVKENSIGIYGDQMTGGSITHLGVGNVMTLEDNAIGFYGTGTSGNMEAEFTGGTTGGNGTIAFYGKGINMKVTSDISLGNNTAVGIVSQGTGNVTYNGAISVGEKSIGIYKADGTGVITTSAGNWNIGKGGYGIYAKQSGALASTINNGASMILDTSAVGIFSDGKNKVYNSGNITVGATDLGPSGDHSKTDDHLNSVGMYLAGGTIAENTGTITVNHDHSVGVYVTGTGSYFTNKGAGVLNIDGGGVGILVKDGGIALNEGTITLGTNLAACGAETVGMAAFNGGRILNTGTINVNAGVGMLVETGAVLDNTGVLNVTGGVGIQGAGTVINKGTINVSGSGTATNLGGASGTANMGAVKIESDGTITINDQYVAIGGTLNAAGAIVVNGAYVDVTTGVPMFNASNVTGEVKLLSNFASTGNGISYLFQNFLNTAAGTVSGSKLTTKTSPLFVAKITTDGHLAVAKRPYADLTIGEQFDAMDKGLDNILKNSGGSGGDAEILKGLNEYLDGLAADQFERETSQKLSEFRGDIYATIQGRMQDINRAFDNSFYELESSYNLTKDSSKYSVIYTDGNYKDSTLGIDDYDYKVMGLLYMKEKEGSEYGSKYGYTVGFAGSKFDFDDGGSKEDVYSLRVGAHRVKNLSEEHKVSWLSRIELGYNRHIAKRKLNLHETFENKGEYNTYSVALDNRLTKVIYTDLSRQLDVYADLDLEYGKIDDFKESAGSKGGLEVQIKDNDYLSAQAGAGVKASQRIYAGNDISVKVTADVKYAYEFGDNYDGNKARLKNGEEGYYSLITPEEREGKLTGKIGLTVEKANHMGVTFEVEAADESHKKDSSIKYGVRFNYKF